MVDDDLYKILNPHTPLKNYRSVCQQKRIFQNQFHHLQRIHLIYQDLRGRESLDNNLSYINLAKGHTLYNQNFYLIFQIVILNLV